VTGLTITPSPTTASAVATYTVAFSTSASGSLGSNSSITLVLAPGSTLPSSPSNYKLSDAGGHADTVSTVTLSAVGGSATDNQAVIDLSTSGITASDAVTLVIIGVINPDVVSSSDTGSISTSADTVAATSSPYSITTAPPPPVVNGTYVPLTPARLVDTRCSESPLLSSVSASYCATLPSVDSALASPGGHSKIHVRVTGVGGVPSSGVSAVLVNLTFAGSFSTGGFLSVYPTGSGANPATFSDLNWSPANYTAAVANLAVVEVGSAGQITIYNGATSYTNIIVDVEGYYLSGSSGTGSGGSGSTGTGISPGSTYVPLTPARLVDTRCSESPLLSSVSASYCATLP